MDYASLYPWFDNNMSFFFMYHTIFIKLGLCYSLEMFEKEILIVMSIASTQLHQNNEAFIRVFSILCNHFDVPPLSNVFFFIFLFFEFRSYNRQLWIE